MRMIILLALLAAAAPAASQDRAAERVIRDRQIERQYQRRNQPYDPSGTRIFGGQPQQQRSIPPAGVGSTVVPNR